MRKRHKQILLLWCLGLLGIVVAFLTIHADFAVVGVTNVGKKDDSNNSTGASAFAPAGMAIQATESTVEYVADSSAMREAEKIQKAWGAGTGLEAWNLLKHSDFNDPEVLTALYTVSSACKAALKPYSSEAVQPSNVVMQNHAKAAAIFLAQYCGDAPALIAQIDAALAPGVEDVKRRGLHAIAHNVEFVPRQQPKRLENLEKLRVASATSVEAADAVINEILLGRNPSSARGFAGSLAGASVGTGALSSWNDFLPPRLPWEERNLVFTIAAELNVCNRVRGCGANTALTMFECAIAGRRCQPNEDLLSYRRRTTSPMLYQAAEQIAAAMQARRYR